MAQIMIYHNTGSGLFIYYNNGSGLFIYYNNGSGYYVYHNSGSGLCSDSIVLCTSLHLAVSTYIANISINITTHHQHHKCIVGACVAGSGSGGIAITAARPCRVYTRSVTFEIFNVGYILWLRSFRIVVDFLIIAHVIYTLSFVMIFRILIIYIIKHLMPNLVL